MAEADAIEDSLERLHIDEGNGNEQETHHVSTATDEKEELVEPTQQLNVNGKEAHHHEHATTSPHHLICDAWYGFPSQKRPRKERINAVSRQLANFLEWRSAIILSASGENSARSKDKLLSGALCCDVSLLGEDGDIQAVHTRMNELAGKLPPTSSEQSSDEGVQFQSNVSIHEFVEQKAKYNNTSSNSNMGEVVYLSPDASNILPSTSPPPNMVIVGMLIDRRITTDRSRIRAEEGLKIKAVKLPLDELNVKKLTSNEPLNVDTVMELMQRWWWNCDKVAKTVQIENATDDVKTKLYKRCFLEAAAWSMKTQRERHPNRTIHKTSKE